MDVEAQEMAQTHFATQPGIGSQHTYCKYSGHGTIGKEQEKGCLAYEKTCRRCMMPAHFRAACRPTARAYSTSNENPDYKKWERFQPMGLPNPSAESTIAETT